MQGVDQIDLFMRLALKAQSQCRATLETLAEIKNPPVFAQQANIANGPQQVNNAALPPAARGKLMESQPIKLLEGVDARMDGSPEGGAGRRHSPLEAVDPIHRPKKRRR